MRKPLVVAVTVLTSLNDKALARSRRYAPAMDAQVVRTGETCERLRHRRRRVLAAGDSDDASSCRGPDFKIVTPGIRMPGQSANDQQRMATPREAMPPAPITLW